MLDGAFKQETSNIKENTFSACNINKGRMFEFKIMALLVLWVQINTSNAGRTRFCSTRIFFVNGFWQLDPKPPNRMSDEAIVKIDKYLKR